MEFFWLFVGAVIGTAPGWVLAEFVSPRLQQRRAKQQGRLDLVLELVGHRFRGADRFGRVNQVPILFGDDQAVMVAWRRSVKNQDVRLGNPLEGDLLMALIQSVGLKADREDIDWYIGPASERRDLAGSAGEESDVAES